MSWLSEAVRKFKEWLSKPTLPKPTPPGGLPAPPPKVMIAETVLTKRFALMDENGKPAIVLDTQESGPFVRVMQADGKFADLTAPQFAKLAAARFNADEIAALKEVARDYIQTHPKPEKPDVPNPPA